MVTIYTEKEGAAAALEGARIAILGYGTQGRAHARHLRDSGHEVVVGARAGSDAARSARADGFRVLPLSEASAEADLIALLTPDRSHDHVYAAHIAPNLRRGGTLLVAHGFSVHYHQIDPRHDIDVVLVAPKGRGQRTRDHDEAGVGVPCLFAVRQDATGSARARALAYAGGVGGAAGGAIETSFAEETETRQLALQALRDNCSPGLVAAAIETLTQAGYQPEVACFQCLDEPKPIMDGVRVEGIIPAEGPVDTESSDRLRELLRAIQEGPFAGSRSAPQRLARQGGEIIGGADADQGIEAAGVDRRQHGAWPNPQQEVRAA